MSFMAPCEVRASSVVRGGVAVVTGGITGRGGSAHEAPRQRSIA